jgi:glycosyltransferase involved in cell wall biosynthesis
MKQDLLERPLRVIVLSHAHPDLMPGGGERAAYAMFRHLKLSSGLEPLFLARCEPSWLGHDGRFAAFRGRADEILAAPPPCHPFTHTTSNFNILDDMIGELVERYAPDVVHMHHFVFWGLEAMECFRRRGVRVVFTLHEFMAICHRHGQMLRVDGRLCASASPADCHHCFEDWPSGKFFLRQRIFMEYFNKVDAFVSPSRFLAERYHDWGVARGRIVCIENPLSPELLDEASRLGDERRRTPGDKIRFGFFGQINPYKGVDVLLSAAALLSEEERSRIEIDLHGANLEIQSEEFAARIRGLLDEVKGHVRLRGRYDNEQVLRLMSEVDAIVVPSIWWENSPVVIQEALILGKTVICSDIGGMVEKASAGSVISFPPGSASRLAAILASFVPGEATGASTVAMHRDYARMIESLYRKVAGVREAPFSAGVAAAF